MRSVTYTNKAGVHECEGSAGAQLCDQATSDADRMKTLSGPSGPGSDGQSLACQGSKRKGSFDYDIRSFDSLWTLH